MTEDAVKMPKQKRLPLWSKIVIGLIALVVILMTAVRLLAMSSVGRGLVEKQIEALNVSGQRIEIEGLKGDLFSSFRIERLQLRDANGIWAEIEDVRLKWKPDALLGKRVILKELAISDMLISRRPEISPSEETPKKKSSGFALKGARLDNFYLDHFLLEKGVLAERVSGSADAKLRWTTEDAHIKAELRPGEDGGDLLVADFGWDERNPLNGKFTLVGPKGGLFASLLQLEEAQSIRARFETEGGLENISGNGEATIDGQPWLQITITPEADSYLVDTELNLERHPLTREQVARVGDTVNAKLTLNRDDRAKERVVELDIETASVNAKLTDISTTKARKSAQLELSIVDPGMLLPEGSASLKSAKIKGEITGKDAEYGFEGQLLGEAFARPEIAFERMEGPLKFVLADKVLTAETLFTASNVMLRLRDEPKRISRADFDANLSLDLEAERIAFSNLNVRTPKSGVILMGDSGFDFPATLSIRGNGRVDLAELGLYDTGQIRGEWTLDKASETRRAFMVDLSGSGLSGKNQALAPWIGKQVKLSAKGNFVGGNKVNISELRMLTDAIELNSSGHLITNGPVNLTGRLKTSASYPLQAEFPGLSGEFSASGELKALTLKADMAADQAGTGEYSLSNPNVVFDGHWVENALNGSVRIDGGLQEKPLAVTTDLVFRDGNWVLSEIDGKWQDLSLSGGASGQGGDISSIRAGLKLSGALPDGLPAESIDLKLDASGQQVKAGGSLTNLNAGPLSKSEIKLQLDGTRAKFNYVLALEGVATLGGLPQETDVKLAGAVRGLDGTEALEVQGNLNAEIGKQVFETSEPFLLRQTDRGLAGKLLVSAFDGRVMATLDDGGAEPLSAFIEGIALCQVMTLFGQSPLDGEANLELTLRDFNGAAKADISGILANVSTPESNARPVSFVISGRVDEKRGIFDIYTPDAQMLQGRVDLNLPLQAQLSAPFFSMDAEGEGTIDASLMGPIDNMSAIFLPDDIIMKGTLDAKISGPYPFRPETLKGNVSFREGIFQHEMLGSDLEALGFDLTLSEQKLVLSDFSGVGRKGGTLAGQGSLDYSSDLNSNLKVNADKLVLVNRKEARAVATGTFGVDLSGDVYEIVGDLVLNEGQFRLDAIPSSGSAPTLDVRFKGEEVKERKAAPLISLNMNVSAPHSLKLVGKGMDAELGLDTKIRGTASDPRIDGSARIVRGQFELLGKRFEFTESNIAFQGDPMKARLNIEATRQADDFLARVEITGTPERPSINLTAEPELPEDEVLSRVLFGRSPSQLSGLEAARLAAALASLSGGGGFDMMGGIENLTGFDSVDVGQNSDGQFEVATGRYLSDDIYMELSSGGGGSPGVSVEWEARDNVSVEAETKPGEGQTLSVQWKKDFD